MRSMWEVVPATLADVAAVAAIERVANPTPWPLASLTGHFAGAANWAWLAKTPERVGAFALGATICDEAHLYEIATAPNVRRQGAARTVLQWAMQQARGAGATAMWLEVRASNTSAIALYEACGFALVSVRLRYYQDGEAAQVMRAGF